MSFARRGYLNFWRKENYIPLSELVSRFGPLDKAKLEVCPQVVSVAGVRLAEFHIRA